MSEPTTLTDSRAKPRRTLDEVRESLRDKGYPLDDGYIAQAVGLGSFNGAAKTTLDDKTIVINAAKLKYGELEEDLDDTDDEANDTETDASETQAQPDVEEAAAEVAEAAADEAAEESIDQGDAEAKLLDRELGRKVDDLVLKITGLLGEPVTVAEVLDAAGRFGKDGAIRLRTRPIHLADRIRDQRQPADNPDSFGYLLAEYRKLGHIGLTSSTAKGLFPEKIPAIEKLEFDSELSEELAEIIQSRLDITLAICVQLQADACTDIAPMIASVTVKDADPKKAHKGPVRNYDEFHYTALCGHSAMMLRWELAYRVRNDNARVGTYFEFCDDCTVRRINLFEAIPGAATSSEDTCIADGLRLFEKATGYFKSRRELLSNLLRGVMDVNDMVRRVQRLHRPDSKVHLQAMSKNLDDQKSILVVCEKALKDFDTQVYNAVALNPEHSVTLVPRIPEELARIRESFGLPRNTKKYQELLMKHGLAPKVQPPKRRVAAKSKEKS